MAFIKTHDGAVLHVCVKPGQVLTAEDEAEIIKYIQFVRDRKAKLQAKLKKVGK